MDINDTISDVAQSTTLGFDALGLFTGNLGSQSFFPPGKVADFFGFQYMRDNDPSGQGHNTNFMTEAANNVLNILTSSQVTRLENLANQQVNEVNSYALQRYPLMEAFNQMINGTAPNGGNLNESAVVNASEGLYAIDGQLSLDRAQLYSSIIGSLSSSQKSALSALKNKGSASWPNITNDQVASKTQGLSNDANVLVMTYAGDILSWYNGSVAADTYFCPEGQGTYFGSFFLKDAPAVNNPGYSISTTVTGDVGADMTDSSRGYLTASQAASISNLVNVQRNNLNGIVGVRSQISSLLSSLQSGASADSIKNQVMSLSQEYGELDGQDVYQYATTFASVYKTLGADQKSKLVGLRNSVLSSSYFNNTPDYIYSNPVDPSVVAQYISNTNYLFGSAGSSAGVAGSSLIQGDSDTDQLTNPPGLANTIGAPNGTLLSLLTKPSLQSAIPAASSTMVPDLSSALSLNATTTGSDFLNNLNNNQNGILTGS